MRCFFGGRCETTFLAHVSVKIFTMNKVNDCFFLFVFILDYLKKAIGTINNPLLLRHCIGCSGDF